MNIGVLGAGQLGRMLALAGLPHAHTFRLFAPDQQPCAAAVAPTQRGDYTDTIALNRFAHDLDVITCEFENVPVDALRELAKTKKVFPPAQAFSVAQDRIAEKTYLNSLGIATAPYAPVDTLSDLKDACSRLGLPAILKTRRFGYDGRGQIKLRSTTELADAFTALGGRDLILEGFVRFARELSIIAVRGRDGDERFYPLCDNTHTDGILSLTRAPAAASDAIARQAESIAAKIMRGLDYVGVIVVELFLSADGSTLIANEFAPRVHNSGHWTIEGAITSQFDNHLRAITGMPLGSTDVRSPVAMINLVGHLPPLATLLQFKDVHPHFYGKVVKPGRKVGHVTVLDASDQRVAAVQAACAAG